MLSLPSSSLLKVSIITGLHQNKEVNESRQPFSLDDLYVYGFYFSVSTFEVLKVVERKHRYRDPSLSSSRNAVSAL